MKLRTRILTGYLSVSFLMVGLGVVILLTINTVSPIVDELDREVTDLGQAVSLSGISANILSLRAELSSSAEQFLLTQDNGYERQYDRASRQLSAMFEEAIDKSENQEDVIIFRNVREAGRNLENTEREIMALANAKNIEQATVLSQSDIYVELNAAISDFIARFANLSSSYCCRFFLMAWCSFLYCSSSRYIQANC